MDMGRVSYGESHMRSTNWRLKGRKRQNSIILSYIFLVSEEEVKL